MGTEKNLYHSTRFSLFEDTNVENNVTGHVQTPLGLDFQSTDTMPLFLKCDE